MMDFWAMSARGAGVIDGDAAATSASVKNAVPGGAYGVKADSIEERP